MTTTLIGWIDVAQRSRLSGWAERLGAENEPVHLAFSARETASAAARPIGSILANFYRADRDVRNTGYEGRVGFDVDLRDFRLPAHSFLLDMADAVTGERLPCPPMLICAAAFRPDPVGMQLVAVDGRPYPRLPADIACCTAFEDGVNRVDLPAGTSGLLLAPRARSMPGDARRLGACLTSVEVDGAAVSLDSACLGFGFYDVERADGRMWRWFDDVAYIDLGPCDHPRLALVSVLGLADDAAPPMPAGRFRLAARYRLVDASWAMLPYVGDRFIARPLSPDIRRYRVRGANPPAEQGATGP